MKEDTIEIEILTDGTIKITTDQISPANHTSADSLLREIERLAGGQTTKTKNRHGHAHQLVHEHEYVNQKGG